MDKDQFLIRCNNGETKKCKNCGRNISIINFLSLNSIEYKLVQYCIKCRIKDTNRYNKRVEPYQILFNKFKEKPCIQCKCTIAIEADHINPSKKINKLSDYSYWVSKPIELYKIELDKCQPLCSICHSIKSNKNIRQTKARKLINSYKINKACELCNKLCIEGYECSFDLDHIDQNDKVKDISQMKNVDDIENEIKKCRLLCRNCHQIWSNTQKENHINSRYEFITNHPKYDWLLENFNI